MGRHLERLGRGHAPGRQFRPARVAATVADQSKLSSWADVADGLSALKVLGADSRIDRTNIGVMGWSRGGGAAFNSALETVRRIVIMDDLKFAAHVVFYGPAELQNRDRATDQSPILFFHGESDDYTQIGPTREFADWAQSKGSPVTFVSYPETYHDFDVQGGFSGFSKSTEVFVKCDMVVDVSVGQVTRLNHVDDPKATPRKCAPISAPARDTAPTTPSTRPHAPTRSRNCTTSSSSICRSMGESACAPVPG